MRRSLTLFIALLVIIVSAQIPPQVLKWEMMRATKPVASGGSGPVGNPMFTSTNLGSTRTYPDRIGCSVKTASNIHVTQIGRWVVSGNNQTHTLYLLGGNYSGGLLARGSATILGSVTVNCSGATSGQYLYGSIGSVAVASGTQLTIVSDESSGIDLFYDSANYTPSADFNTLYSVYADSSYYYTSGNGQTYVPVNITYTTP